MTEKQFYIDTIDGGGSVLTANGVELGLYETCDLLNELYEEKEQLLSDKEHLMGCLIRFFGYDDEDIDYNLNRESNREYGKAYYSMKEETEKEEEE